MFICIELAAQNLGTPLYKNDQNEAGAMRTIFHLHKSRPEWMSEFFDEWQIIYKTEKHLIMTLSIIAMILITIVTIHNKANAAKHAEMGVVNLHPN